MPLETEVAVLRGLRERIGWLDAYLGDVEDPERWACDALMERLRGLEERAGVAVGPSPWGDYAPDFEAELGGVRLALVEIHQELLTAGFVVDACGGLEDLPSCGPDDRGKE